QPDQITRIGDQLWFTAAQGYVGQVELIPSAESAITIRYHGEPNERSEEVQAIAQGPDGAVWIGTTAPSRNVLRYNVIKNFGLGAGRPLTPLVTGTDGKLVFATDTGELADVTAQGGLEIVHGSFSGGTGAFDLAVGRDGSFWESQPERNRVVRFEANGLVRIY